MLSKNDGSLVFAAPGDRGRELFASCLMHLRYCSRLTWAIAATGFVWLALIISLTLSDIASRGWLVPVLLF